MPTQRGSSDGTVSCFKRAFLAQRQGALLQSAPRSWRPLLQSICGTVERVTDNVVT